MIRFAVWGEPAPKGSMKVIRGRLFASNPQALSHWAKLVAGTALAAIQNQRHEQYVNRELVVRVEFQLVRPAGHFDARGNVKRGVPQRPRVKPDLDKLVRGVLDPLTGLVFDDDSRIVETLARKVYAERPGATLEIFACDEAAPAAQSSLFDLTDVPPPLTDERSTP